MEIDFDDHFGMYYWAPAANLAPTGLYDTKEKAIHKNFLRDVPGLPMMHAAFLRLGKRQGRSVPEIDGCSFL